VWLETAARAGFVDLAVRRRRPMTVERLRRYPVYREGALDALFALVDPAQHDMLVMSALVTARRGDTPPPIAHGAVCHL
jgi:hypothetical protein